MYKLITTKVALLCLLFNYSTFAQNWYEIEYLPYDITATGRSLAVINDTFYLAGETPYNSFQLKQIAVAQEPFSRQVFKSIDNTDFVGANSRWVVWSHWREAESNMLGMMDRKTGKIEYVSLPQVNRRSELEGGVHNLCLTDDYVFILHHDTEKGSLVTRYRFSSGEIKTVLRSEAYLFHMVLGNNALYFSKWEKPRTTGIFRMNLSTTDTATIASGLHERWLHGIKDSLLYATINNYDGPKPFAERLAVTFSLKHSNFGHIDTIMTFRQVGGPMVVTNEYLYGLEPHLFRIKLDRTLSHAHSGGTELMPVIVFPNPSRNTFRLVGEFDKVEIFDLFGRRISTTYRGKEMADMVLGENLRQGTYLLQIHRGSSRENHRITKTY